MRRGLVLGAGGVLGAAWTIGALAALEEELGWDPRDADVLIGTSAGSVLASALSSGLGVADLLDHQYGREDGRLEFDPDTDSGGAMPPLPRPFVGSPRGLVHSALRPWKSTVLGTLAAAMPQGRGSIEPVGRLVDNLLPHGGWSPHPRTWIVAMDYDSGRRVVFGREGSPRAELRSAVMASCAIPGWFSPVEIGRHRYVDGGVCSPTSVDLVTRLGLDEVVVLSPMTSLSYDTPDSVTARLERRFRRVVTKRVVGEIKKVAAAGTKVTFLGPTADDLAVIGANMMDPRRRLEVLETSLRTSAAALRVDRQTDVA
jgi:NTE family protein